MGKGSDRDWRVAVSLVKVNRKPRHLWRVVDQEGEVLESFVTKEIDKTTALKAMNSKSRQAPEEQSR